MSDTLLIAMRDLRSTLRSARMFLFACGVAVAAILWLRVFTRVPTGTAPPGVVQQTIFESYYKFGGHTISLIVPTTVVIALHTERHDETLPLLRTALFTDTAILAGKGMYALLIALLMLTIILPFSGATFFFAGVGWREFLSAHIELLSWTILSTAVGLKYATKQPNRGQAIVHSLSSLFLLTIILSTIEIFIETIATLGNYTPIGSATTLSWNQPMTLGTGTVYTGFVLFIAWCYFLSAVSSFPTFANMRTDIDPTTEKSRRDNVIWRRALRRSPFQSWRAPQFHGRYWKPHHTIAAVVISFFFIYVSLLTAEPGHLNIVSAIDWLLIAALLISMAIPALAAVEATRDYNTGMMEQIRTTLFTPTEILRVRALPIIQFLLPFSLCVVISMAMFFLSAASRGIAEMLFLLVAFVSAATSLCFVWAVAQLAALTSRKTLDAAIAAYAAVFASWCILVPFAYLTRLGGLRDSIRYLQPFLPLTETNDIRDALLRTNHGFGWWSLGRFFDASHWLMTCALHSVVMLAATAGLFMLSSYVLRRFHLRDR